MVCCAVFGCTSSSKRDKKLEGVKFHTFPKDKELAAKWVHACKRSDTFSLSTATICSLHFTAEDQEKPLMHRLLNYSPRNCRRLKPDAVPVLHLPQSSVNAENKKVDNNSRSERVTIRARKRLVNEMIAMSTTTKPGEKNESNEHVDTVRLVEPVTKVRVVEPAVTKIRVVEPAVTKVRVVEPAVTKVRVVEPVTKVPTIAETPTSWTSIISNVTKVPTVGKTRTTWASKIANITKEPTVGETPTWTPVISNVTSVQASKETTTQETAELKAKIAALEKTVKVLCHTVVSQTKTIEKEQAEKQRVVNNYAALEASLGKIFTPGQLRKLQKPGQRRVHWTAEDIASAISLRRISCKAYDYLRNEMNFPLPGRATLGHWAPGEMSENVE